MAQQFRLEITTPERLLVSADVEQAQIPGQNGYLGILQIGRASCRERV